MGCLLSVCGCDEQPEPELTPDVAKQALLDMFAAVQQENPHHFAADWGNVYSGLPIHMYDYGDCAVGDIVIRIEQKKYETRYDGKGYTVEHSGRFELKRGRWIATKVSQTIRCRMGD